MLERNADVRLKEWQRVIAELSASIVALDPGAHQQPTSDAGERVIGIRALEAAERFRASPYATALRLQRSRNETDTQALERLVIAVRGGVEDRGSDPLAMHERLGGTALVSQSAPVGIPLTTIGAFGVIDDLLPRNQFAVPDRDSILGWPEQVTYMTLSVDGLQTCCGVGLWLFQRGRDAWAIIAPFLYGPPIIADRFKRRLGPVRIGLAASEVTMRESGHLLVDVGLELVTHGLAIAATGAPIWTAQSWTEYFDRTAEVR
jgi:hypothetical protein